MASEPLPDPPQAVAEVWDTGTFDDLECPGLCKVSISRGQKWDDKKAQGSHGGERTFKGSDLASVKIQIKLWTADQYVDFNEQILPLLEPDPAKKKAKVVAFGHAVAWSRGLRAFTVDNVSGPDADPAGFVLYDIDATEHREPDKTNAQGKPGKGAGTHTTCAQLWAQKGLLESLRINYATQRNVYLSPATFDPVKAGEAETHVNEIDVQLDGVKNQMIVIGCSMTPPS